jgi:DNA-damage-inducible protein D
LKNQRLHVHDPATPVQDHFGEVTKMVALGSGAKRGISDYTLSRYACYLVVQNGDPSKAVIANGQTYFALQTRRQELGDEKAFAGMSEDQRRLMLRGELTHHNKALSAAARGAGVETPVDYAVFQDHGYRGLYGGLGAKEIHSRKALKRSQKSLTTWAARNWQQISSAPPRPRKNSDATK